MTSIPLIYNQMFIMDVNEFANHILHYIYQTTNFIYALIVVTIALYITIYIRNYVISTSFSMGSLSLSQLNFKGALNKIKLTYCKNGVRSQALQSLNFLVLFH